MTTKRCTRDRKDRIIAGVCNGIAKHYKLELSLVRAGFMLAFILFGAGAVLYATLWMVMPER